MLTRAVSELRRLCKATGYSLAGYRSAWATEAAFRIEVVALVVLVPLAFWLGETNVERALLFGALFLLVLAELVNTAIEAVVDRIGTDYHPLSGKAKDVGSAGVLLALVHGIVVWALVLWP